MEMVPNLKSVTITRTSDDHPELLHNVTASTDIWRMLDNSKSGKGYLTALEDILSRHENGSLTKKWRLKKITPGKTDISRGIWRHKEDDGTQRLRFLRKRDKEIAGAAGNKAYP